MKNPDLPDQRSPESSYDLSNCDREPIHIPGAIQPHGFLFHLDPNQFKILQLSANVEQLICAPLSDILGRSIGEFIDKQSFDKIRAALDEGIIGKANPLSLVIDSKELMTFDGIIHSYKNALILELEKTSQDETNLNSFYQTIRKAVLALQSSNSISVACSTAAQQIRSITGFDRVTVYKFDDEWNGNVVGEDRSEAMDSLLGQRFPASDIPAQARALYQLNWIRIISDRTYVPSPLVPECNPNTGESLDLSLSTLRSVSPIHLEYMANMGMMASMSVSIIKDGQLWGLISCHHRKSKYLSFQIRSACEFLAEIFSGQMSTIETRDSANQRLELREILGSLETKIANVADFASGLRYDNGILDLTNSTGAAVCLRGKISRYGDCPDEEEISKLLEWLHPHKADLYQISSLQTQYPPAKDMTDTASGLLAVRLSRLPDSYILWFRPEKVKSINWAGNPTKPVEEVNGEMRLHPRKSFQLWQEIVRGQADNYSESEIEVALEFRNIIISKLLAHSVRQLEASNLELDSFAQMVSHDLREPLRGIRIYAKHAIEDDRGKLSDATEQRLNNMISLSEDLDTLLLSLYNFSKLGRVELSFENVSVLEIAQQVVARLKPICEEQGVILETKGEWPELFCDRIRAGEIFQNLVLNAIRYSDKTEKKVVLRSQLRKDLGFVYVFSVEDNGIGISSEHFQDIFQLFKRLHTNDEYPGGTGSGLSMTRRLVEKHGGKIWLESTEGEGSTFYFTLQPQE